MKAFGTYEIAQLCHVTPSTVGNWIEKGLLPTFTTGGGHRRVWDKDLIAFMREHNMPLPPQLSQLLAPQVLVVDDEDQIRRFIRKVIQKNRPDTEIHEASDGFEAGQKIAQLAPALVILDLRLPGIDGLKVCKIIRADSRLKHTRILAVSGNEPETSRRDSLEAGADDFMPKPLDLEGLTSRILKLL